MQTTHATTLLSPDDLLSRSIFPILPWERRSEEALEADVDDEVGTAFCISDSGVFVTAGHVVGGQVDAGMYKILSVDFLAKRLVPIRVQHIIRHRSADLVLLLAAMPTSQHVRPKPLPIGVDVLPCDAKVIVAGYPIPEREEHQIEGSALLGLRLSMQGIRMNGTICDRLDRAMLSDHSGPFYATSIDAPAAMSGAPLISATTGAVHGVVSTTFTATDIRVIRDMIRFPEGPGRDALFRE